MNNYILNSPIMYVTQYWGAPAFVQIIPSENNYSVFINDQPLAVLGYRDGVSLEDLNDRFHDREMLAEISHRIETNILLACA